IEPNEWGDVLAGVFSPLAFLWLIYTSLSQRAELALQRAELAQNNATQDAQREEMHRQVAVMTAQARLLEAQANGRYEPALVVTSTRVASFWSGASLLELTNYNAGVSNMKVRANVTRKATRPSIASGHNRCEGKTIGYLPAGGCLTLAIDHPSLD